MNPFQWLFEVYQQFWLYAGKAWDITPWWAIAAAPFALYLIGDLIHCVTNPEDWRASHEYYDAQFRKQAEEQSRQIAQMSPDPTSPYPQQPEGPGWFGNKQEYANQMQRYVDFYTKPPHQYPEQINRR
jgi:hypothetical protein